MQPCSVCGGVTINATGHCTLCGTFRGNPAPETPGGYGGYQQPVSGPGYGQPVSGGVQPGGYPMSAPPGGYPASGGPAYPPTSGGGYPTSYPPLPPPGGGNKGKPFVVPLVALSVTLIVLVVAIVVVVIVRSDSKGPVAGPTTPPPSPTAEVNPDVDPCVVGKWEVTSHNETVTMEELGDVRFSGGAGATMELTADGDGTTTYSSTAFEGTGKGQTLKLEISGTITYGFTARNGTMSMSNVKSTATYDSFLNDEPVENDEPFSASDDPAKYTCSGNTLTQSTDTFETRFAKVS